MKTEYQPQSIEKKWQDRWHADALYTAIDSPKSKQPKRYILVEFPYPSGEGLHVGHCLSYIAQDVVSRYYRLKGENVLFPMGWDAFGLPAENFAIKHKIHPRQAVEKNIANFKRQIQSLGISFDWSREINTTDPAYYKWTQWIFLQLFKAGLAEKRLTKINWCPKDKIGLAFEEVVDGKCERCGSEVEQREINQWILKITKYADRLIDDLETVDYLPHIKQQQINWIGRSEGLEIDFQTSEGDALRVFTTRPDTIFGATFLVIAPEHPLVESYKLKVENSKEVEKYVTEARKLTDRERQEKKEKTGVALRGITAINPMTKEAMPIFVADYVMMSYGTGAIMAVPAHDERDWEFANNYYQKIKPVIYPKERVSYSEIFPYISHDAPIANRLQQLEDDQKEFKAGIKSGKFCFTGNGILINSEEFNDLDNSNAWNKIADTLVAKGIAERKTNYKLRDWIFSRQHYWGEPIPIIICDSCGYIPLEEKDLPLELPAVDHYEPTDTGESPLAAITEWVNVKCPKCGKPAKRETDTMPNWAGSSWYFLRYTDPHNDKVFADKKKLNDWLPVDLYNGGMEHTTLHLLYSRFWHKFLYDQGLVPTVEPYARRVSHGMILGPDNQKMSKSRGNVINPDSIVEKYGADTLRLYEMFMGEYDGVKVWSENSLQGVHRFLRRIWRYFENVSSYTPSSELDYLTNNSIRKIEQDIERRSFNTIVSQLMIFFNAIEEQNITDQKTLEIFVLLMSPVAPHITEEFWQKLGHSESVHTAPWPTFDEEALHYKEFIIPVQVNGKIRGQLHVSPILPSEEEVKSEALKVVSKYLAGATPKKIIYIPGKIVSIVV